MGSIISLGIDRFEIDWGKNQFFNDYSALFSPSDVAQIPYYYADGVVETEEGLSRKLSTIKRRLDLLGYSLNALPKIYQDHLDSYPSDYSEVTFTFEQFSNIMRSIDLSSIEHDTDERDYDLGEFVSRSIFSNPELKQYLPEGISIDSNLGAFFENLSPYLTLRLLAENEQNSEKLVQWRYSDVLEGGWIERDQVVKPLPDKSKILIVTEGSTDTFVIKRTISEILPDIADFFDFIDMEQSYPFTGTGNLYNFCQGLARIHIQNKVLAIFDNDAAGIEKYIQSRNLSKPNNLHICRLPDHESFSDFLTIGPNGIVRENINGAAVSIECFLDLQTIPEKDRLIRWTAFNHKSKRYQGEFERKSDLIGEFKKANLKDGSYDTTKLESLLEHLINEWIKNQE